MTEEGGNKDRSPRRKGKPSGQRRLLALATFVAVSITGMDSAVAVFANPTPLDSLHTSAADAWTGWRGLSAQGLAQLALPSRWSADDGIRWKTSIPGQGHSSPIVFGDRVYVSTAYGRTNRVLVQRGLGWLTFGLVLAVATLAVPIVACRCGLGRSHIGRDLTAGISIVTAVTVLAVIACYGFALLDIPRCNIRGWIASTVFASLSLMLAAAATDCRRSRLAIGISAIGFAIFVLAAFPSKSHAFRGGLSSLPTQISIVTAAAPLLIGVTLVTLARWSTATIWRAVLFVVTITAATTGVFIVRNMLVFRDAGLPEVTYVPQLSVWILALSAAPVVYVWLGSGPRARTPAITFCIVLVGALSLVLTAALGIEYLATRSPYLAYQLGAPKLESQPGGLALGASGAALVVYMIRVLRTAAATKANLPSSRLSRAFGLTALALATVFFIRVNYVQGQGRTVRAIVSLDRHSGEVRWILGALEGPQAPIDGRNSPATPTPVTDGHLVCAYFGTPGLMCTDRHGRLAWSRTDLAYEGYYGVGFSPVLSDRILIIASEPPDGLASVHALDAVTGTTLWKREFRTSPALSGNNRTPIVAEVDRKKVLILWGLDYVKALALGSGDELWGYRFAAGGDLVSSLTSDAERLYLSDITGTVALDYASLVSGHDPVRWTNKARANCASPVLSNGILFTVTDTGIATALRVDTGATLWRQRLPGHYFASLVASPEAVYFTNSDGVTTVVGAERTFRVIAQNHLGEPTVASMAAVRGELFVRTATKVYAITDPSRLR